jgi:regulator of RNase E activity RraA
MTDSELYTNIYCGIAYDAMREMGHSSEDFFINIKPKNFNNATIIGQAITTMGRRVGDWENYPRLDEIRLKLYGEFEEIKKKVCTKGLKPIVILESNDNKVAHSGDITSLIYKKFGCAGFITDGIVRDISLIRKLDFPVFANGLNPIDAINYWAITKYNEPVFIMGVRVDPSDVLIAGEDGVIRVPVDLWPKFKTIAKEILKKENAVREIISSRDFDEEGLYNFFEDLVGEKGRW